MVTTHDIKQWIETGLSESRVISAEGDGHHFEAVVLCPTFEGQTALTRHRLVYNALGSHIQSDIHALSLKTYTPDEYERG
ncbi:BolA family protein [Coxiella burnetii]|uniref:BolA family protein n=1 Tax=Coxiella burnetii TaxID=777 RepID=UPI00051F1740|nr:BolA/IbaG family iron-sulfur metabolism protein [Coxiella burnetii]AIT63511.1 BolA-like protein [Coxiella burnetii str. Namibia]